MVSPFSFLSCSFPFLLSCSFLSWHVIFAGLVGTALYLLYGFSCDHLFLDLFFISLGVWSSCNPPGFLFLCGMRLVVMGAWKMTYGSILVRM